MAVIEATRPVFWVQLAESTQLSALSIQPLNHPILISVHLRKSAAKLLNSPVFSASPRLRGENSVLFGQKAGCL
jgi:hypothetical protein